MDLRPELLCGEQHEPEVPPTLRYVEEHRPHVRVGAVARRILVQLVHEYDDVADPQRPLLEVFPQLRHHAGKNEILRIAFDVGDVHHVHTAVAKRTKRKVAHGPVVRDETAATARDVTEAVAHLANGRHVVRAPRLGVGPLQSAEQVAEPAFEVAERPHEMFRGQVLVVGEILVDHALLDELDQRAGLGVDIVLAEQHVGVLQDLAQAPRERPDIAVEGFIRAQRVQRIPARSVWGEILDMLERRRRDTELFVQRAVGIIEPRSRLVEKAEVGALHIEADCRHAAPRRREMGKDRRQQPLDRTGFCRQPRHAGNIEMGRLRAEQELGVEIHG